MEETISRAEHEEFVRRMEAEHRRQNRRIELLEDTVRQIGALTTSVERLAVSVQTMGKTLARQSDRLAAIEDRDGAMWRKAVGYAVTAALGLALGFVSSRLGLA